MEGRCSTSNVVVPLVTIIVAQYSKVEVWYRMDSMLTRSRHLMYTVDRQAVDEVDANYGTLE